MGFDRGFAKACAIAAIALADGAGAQASPRAAFSAFATVSAGVPRVSGSPVRQLRPQPAAKKNPPPPGRNLDPDNDGDIDDPNDKDDLHGGPPLPPITSIRNLPPPPAAPPSNARRMAPGAPSIQPGFSSMPYGGADGGSGATSVYPSVKTEPLTNRSWGAPQVKAVPVSGTYSYRIPAPESESPAPAREAERPIVDPDSIPRELVFGKVTPDPKIAAPDPAPDPSPALPEPPRSPSQVELSGVNSASAAGAQ